jgi:L-2-hydroxyglutarate oxidase LhgO
MVSAASFSNEKNTGYITRSSKQNNAGTIKAGYNSPSDTLKI